MNNRLGYLKALFNELHRLGDIDYPNPLPLRLQERPISFHSTCQIAELLEALDDRTTSPGIGLIARVCLSTGPGGEKPLRRTQRWSCWCCGYHHRSGACHPPICGILLKAWGRPACSLLPSAPPRVVSQRTEAPWLLASHL